MDGKVDGGQKGNHASGDKKERGRLGGRRRVGRGKAEGNVKVEGGGKGGGVGVSFWPESWFAATSVKYNEALIMIVVSRCRS